MFQKLTFVTPFYVCISGVRSVGFCNLQNAASNFIKKESVSQLFPVNFAKSLRTHLCKLIRIARVSLAFQAANKFVQYRPHWF